MCKRSIVNIVYCQQLQLHQKLFGGLEDLKKTTNFITAAGLVV